MQFATLPVDRTGRDQCAYFIIYSASVSRSSFTFFRRGSCMARVQVRFNVWYRPSLFSLQIHLFVRVRLCGFF